MKKRILVAEINGMDIENVLTVYEQDVSDTDDIGSGYIVAGERYIDIYIIRIIK